VVGVLLLAAPALGPTVGGALIGAFGWPSIFMVNVPFGVLGILGVLRLSPAIASPADRNARFDPLGMLMLGGGLGLGLYGLASAQENGWLASRAWPFWAAGLALLAVYVVWASRVEHPAVDLGLVRGLQSAIGLSVVVLGVVVLGAVLLMVPVYVQAIQGFSAFHAGLILLPQDVVMAGGLVLGDRLSKRGLARASAVGGAALLVTTTAILLALGVTTPSWIVAAMLAGRGLALALIIQPILDVLMRGIPMAKLADANTLFNVVQRVAGSFAIALLATLLEERERFHLSQALHGAPFQAFDPARSGIGPSLTGLPEGLRQTVQAALMAGWLDVVVVLVAISVATFVMALLFRSPRAVASEFPVDYQGVVDEPSAGLVA
jgi:Major Facilitator Superfamily